MPAKIFVATIIRMGKKREPGRPPKPEGERKTAELRIRLTAAERAALDAAADGKTSTWAREILLREAQQKNG